MFETSGFDDYFYDLFDSISVLKGIESKSLMVCLGIYCGGM